MSETENTSESEGAMNEASDAADTNQWLEGVEDEKALAWVREQNALTLEELEADPRFEAIQNQAEAILDATDKIPYGTVRDGFVYNFWRDDKNVRGLWRRIPVDEYLVEDRWETVIDVDTLAEEEDENWVWAGATCHAPAFDRCLVRLSQGGKDASVMREYDMKAKAFVAADPFVTPEGKSWAAWLDADTLMISADLGAETVTKSGYPRAVRMWKRGTPLADAPIMYEGTDEDVAVWPWVPHVEPGEKPYAIYDQSLTFWTSKMVLSDPATEEQELLPLPEDIKVQEVYRDQIIATLRSDWTLDGTTMVAGTIVAIPLEDWLAGVRQEKDYEAQPAPRPIVILEPDEKTSVQGISVTRNEILIQLLVDVKPKLERATWDAEAGTWTRSSVKLPAEFGTVMVMDASEFEETAYISHESPVDPRALYRWKNDAAEMKQIAALPARFDASDTEVRQHRATSSDGTEVPYFVVIPDEHVEGTPSPTYLNAYGGFEVPTLPYYRSLTGKAWIERGGIFALANIRGGGEYGPRWHQAALGKNRQKAFDDFYAVAEDLVARGYTTHEQLGIHGGSNGGLLMGVALTQRPKLWGAVIIDVPLLDMLRYHLLLAGASWVGEYGSPDDPELRPVLEAYSPYHNLDADESYPRPLVTTSTADDRVHPGHARKFTAKMIAQGHPVLYYENIEGGHGGAANNKQVAFMYAIKYVYMLRALGLD